ncbi:MAG TPA: UPF0182 family protein, partial [Rhodomicrobium sp.]|nr:UPF0182 family protein [Rhodomicrobium sp.]
MTLKRIAVAIIALAVFFIALELALDFLVDWLWFSSVGYLDVFLTIFAAKAGLFLIAFAASALVLWLNGALAHRLFPRKGLPPASGPWGHAGDPTLAALLTRSSQDIPWRILIAAVALALASLIALGEAGLWDTALRFIWQAPYGQSDPLYGKDFGFYLFSLPASVAIKNWMLLTLILSALFAGALYFVQGNL